MIDNEMIGSTDFATLSPLLSNCACEVHLHRFRDKLSNGQVGYVLCDNDGHRTSIHYSHTFPNHQFVPDESVLVLMLAELYKLRETTPTADMIRTLKSMPSATFPITNATQLGNHVRKQLNAFATILCAQIKEITERIEDSEGWKQFNHLNIEPYVDMDCAEAIANDLTFQHAKRSEKNLK